MFSRSVVWRALRWSGDSAISRIFASSASSTRVETRSRPRPVFRTIRSIVQSRSWR
jgi:hypothetical protein